MVLRVKVSPDLIGGDVDEGYGRVADVFRRNMVGGQEVGAAVAVYRDGVKVVDLWGGFRNGISKAPWAEGTLVNMFSTTKGVASLAVAVAASRGIISYDAKVADYWPKFAQSGKGEITVRQLLSHQAGLPAIDTPLTLPDLADPKKMSAALAARASAWTPGTRHGYHAVTLGWYESELIRHADSAGRSLGQFFADEVAKPLGLDFYIGLPAEVDRNLVAHLHGWSRAELLLHLNALPPRFVVGMVNPRGLTGRTFANPKGVGDIDAYNREEVRRVEIPAANGIGTARSVAKVYGCAATGGLDLGLTANVLDALAKPAVPPTRGLRDKVLHVDTTFSLGFIKPFPTFRFGSSAKAFGTPGAGGSFGFADPDTGTGFAYAMNRCGVHLRTPPGESWRFAKFFSATSSAPRRKRDPRKPHENRTESAKTAGPPRRSRTILMRATPRLKEGIPMSTWLITGCSTGLGHALAEAVIGAGHNAVVTARDVTRVSDLADTAPGRVLAVALDVTEPGQVASAVQQAEERFGSIDVLVNNAGYGYRGAIEEGDDAGVRTLFETHFFGTVAMIKAVLPGMRSRRSGAIVNISSIGVQLTPVGSGYYSAAKAAIEGVSGALRDELAPLGISVTVVEPGAFRTDFAGRSLVESATFIDDYAGTAGQRRKENDTMHGNQAGDPAKAGAAIIAAVASSEPPAFLLLGPDALMAYRYIADRRANEIAKWEQLTTSTNFDS